MTTTDTDCSAFGASAALAIIRKAAEAPEGRINAATETQLQNALHMMRSAGHDPDFMSTLERMAALMRTMVEARRQGRVNLYTSKLIRLRKLAFD